MSEIGQNQQLAQVFEQAGALGYAGRKPRIGHAVMAVTAPMGPLG
jgi:hypothetical protein